MGLAGIGDASSPMLYALPRNQRVIPAISPVMNELEKLAEHLTALPDIYQDVAKYELSVA